MRFAVTVVGLLAVAGCSGPGPTARVPTPTLVGGVRSISTSPQGALTAVFVDGSSPGDGDLACEKQGSFGIDSATALMENGRAVVPAELQVGEVVTVTPRGIVRTSCPEQGVAARIDIRNTSALQ